MNLEEERIHNIEEVLSVIPDSFGLKFIHTSESSFKLINEFCVLDISFERFESTSSCVTIYDPNHKNDPGMSLILLRHLLHANGEEEKEESDGLFVGQLLINNFSDILRGDFRMRKQYDKVEKCFYDKIFDVISLPKTHPARQKYDDFDIGWLELMPE